MASLHRSPLICLCFQDLLATFGNIEDSFSPLIIQALSLHIIKKKENANYKTEVKKQLKRPIKSINNDRGGEYETFDEF